MSIQSAAEADRVPRFATIRGDVIGFDEQAGWGTVRTTDGVELFFHCTQIADGTRTIPVGQMVCATVLPIGIGTFEATELRPAS